MRLARVRGQGGRTMDSMRKAACVAGSMLSMLLSGAGLSQAQVSDLAIGQTSAYWSIAATGAVVHAVYWRSVGTGNEEIFYRRSTNRGDAWDPERQLTNAPGLSRSPSVAAFGSSVYAVWADDRAGNFEVYLKVSQDGGTTWGND